MSQLVPKKKCFGQAGPSKERNGSGETDLPAGIVWKVFDLHAMRRAPWARLPALVGREVASARRMTRASCKLNGQALAHEVGAILEDPLAMFHVYIGRMVA
jgi:hypothetical protein